MCVLFIVAVLMFVLVAMTGATRDKHIARSPVCVRACVEAHVEGRQWIIYDGM